MKYNKPNTKPVPILITLAAAGISCVISILQEASFRQFVLRLLLTVVIFGIFGSLVRVFLDMGFKTDQKEEEKKAQEEAEKEAEEESEDSDDSSESQEEVNEEKE